MDKSQVEFINSIDNEGVIKLEEKGFSYEDNFTFKPLLHEYEQVIIKSLVTSFGLDFLLVKDRRGGDVDTIHTVRDDSVKDYANKNNEADYKNRGEYDKSKYDSTKGYREKNKQASEEKKAGELKDSYTGQVVSRNADIDMDHSIPTAKIQDDPGVYLSGVSPYDLASDPSNLNPTDRSINRSQKMKDADEFIQWLEKTGPERREEIKRLKEKGSLSDKDRKDLHKYEQLEAVDPKKLKRAEENARKKYESTIARAYYTSDKFMRDTINASLKKGMQMGVRQCLGLILTEVWLSIREEFPKIIQRLKNFDLEEFLLQVAETIKKVFRNVKEKYHELINSFKDGVVAGVLASISSTIINVFLTTSKCAGKILRESWASIVESLKVLIMNPDCLLMGEKIKAAAKIVSASIAVICGSIIMSIVAEKLACISIIPGELKRVITDFLGALTTGVLTISLLYFLDNSKIIRQIVQFLNQFKDSADYALEFYKEANEKLAQYVSELLKIDIDTFRQEADNIRILNLLLYSTDDNETFSKILYDEMMHRNIEIPFINTEGLDRFMEDENSILIF